MTINTTPDMAGGCINRELLTTITTITTIKNLNLLNLPNIQKEKTVAIFALHIV